jgi:hypothetical protein
MKNIHVLPTDKPSRLYLTTHEYIFEEGYSLSTDECENKNIYITSDEEIKDDWCYDEYNKVVFKNTGAGTPGASKKIILTTDGDLIKDGIQAIPDEFLEWFVKNPSCERVEVNLNSFGECHMKGDGCSCYDTADQSLCELHYPNYKIIIPQEEPKQGTMSEAIKQVINNQLKQETLEEAADKYSKYHYANREPYLKELYAAKISFEDGAKWQAERMYSEKEVLNIIDIFLCEYRDSLINKTDFYPALRFEQFKKK